MNPGSIVRRITGVCILSVMMILVAAGWVLSGATDAAEPLGPGLPGSVIVAFEPTLSPPARASLLDRLNAIPDAEIEPLSIMRVRVPIGQEQAVVDTLARQPGVRYAELDYVARALEVPNDPRWPDQWNMRQIHADRAWDQVPDVGGLVIAIVDTGVDLDHPDLENVLWTNPGEVPGNGVDDDGNGKVDDYYGWHFGEACNYTEGCWHFEDNRVQDDNGHGTHVAGIAGAQANNGEGVAGVAWGARLMVVKVLNQYGYGSCFDVAAGIVYAADNGASVINLCIACNQVSEPLQDAISYARNVRGRLIVAAAGNDNGPLAYPASDPLTLSVGAVDSDDQKAHFSNHGPGLDVVAPGVQVISTWPLRDGYFRKSGTSMAGPHVSGLAALVWAANPSLTAAQVSQVITSTAVDLGAAGWDQSHGYGRVDAYAAVQASLSGGNPPPETPTPSVTRTPKPTATHTPIPSSTATVTDTPAPSATATGTAALTPQPTVPDRSPTPTATGTLISALTPTSTVSMTPSPTVTPSPTPTEPLTPTLAPTHGSPAQAQLFLPLMLGGQR